MHQEIIKYAERQHGVVTYDQATGAGLSPRQVRHRLENGDWERLGKGVYKIAGSPRTWEQRLIALTLTAGPTAAASHRSAAALLGIPGFERHGSVEVTTPRPRRHRQPAELIHRWRPFPEHHLTTIDGIPTTRVARTLCDLAGVLHPGRTERAVDNCLAMGIASPATLEAAFWDLASRGRKGTAVMRQLLADRSDGYVPPASELEARFRDLLQDAGLPEPVRQMEAGDDRHWVGRVDVAYPARQLIVELDSARHHTSRLDKLADQARDLSFVAGGWQVERFTWNDLARDPSVVITRLRALLAEPAA